MTDCVARAIVSSRRGNRPRQHGAYSPRHESAMAREIRQTPAELRPQSEDASSSDTEKHDDGRDLDRSEPVLRLAPEAHGQQIQHGKRQDQSERQHPGRHVGKPVVQEPRSGDCLERDDDDPEVPVHPAGQESREFAECQSVVFVETPNRGIRSGHLAEHAHHEHDECASKRK
jgi:hypothetical protein